MATSRGRTFCHGSVSGAGVAYEEGNYNYVIFAQYVSMNRQMLKRAKTKACAVLDNEHERIT
eukprot:5093943-Prymnesium_polylepis.1